jgi:hypothetical protein
MKPKLLFISLMMFGVALKPAAVLAGNLLLNGGFNVLGFPFPNDFDKILAPWGWNGPSLGYTWGNDGVPLAPGVTLDSGGMVGFGEGQIYQDVATTPGQVYALTITAHARGSTTGTWIQPLWNGTALPLDHAEYLLWTATTYDIQATGSSTRITIEPAPNNQDPTWIDSVTLVTVPEPTSGELALLSLAVPGLLMMREKQLVFGQGSRR